MGQVVFFEDVHTYLTHLPYLLFYLPTYLPTYLPMHGWLVGFSFSYYIHNHNHNNKNDTCAWTPNKVFIHFLLVSVETARVLLQSWWARLSTGASREAPVDNECFSIWELG